MWPWLLLLAAPIVAAALAAWGIWRRNWVACVPAVVIGVWPFLPAEWISPLDDLDDWAMRFVHHVEPRSLAMTALLVDAAALGSLIALWAGWSRGTSSGRCRRPTGCVLP